MFILKVAVPIENLDEYVLGAGQCPFWVRGMGITIALKISRHNVAEVPLDALILLMNSICILHGFAVDVCEHVHCCATD